MSKSTNTRRVQREMAQNAGERHAWPEHAGEGNFQALDLYYKQQDARAHTDWPQSDLNELARVSVLQVMVAQETDKLVGEGGVVLGGKMFNQMVANPRAAVVISMTSSINSTLRRLGITGFGKTTAEKRTSINRANKAREAERALMDSEGRNLRYSGEGLM